MVDDNRIYHDRRWVEHRRGIERRDERRVKADAALMRREIVAAFREGVAGITLKVDARGVVHLYHSGVNQNAHTGRRLKT